MQGQLSGKPRAISVPPVVAWITVCALLSTSLPVIAQTGSTGPGAFVGKAKSAAGATGGTAGSNELPPVHLLQNEPMNLEPPTSPQELPVPIPGQPGTPSTSGSTGGAPAPGAGALPSPMPAGAPTGKSGEGGPTTPIGGQGVEAAPRYRLQGYLTLNQTLNEALLKSPRAAAVRANLKIQAALYPAATIMPDPVLYRDEAAVSEQMLRFGPQTTWDPPWKMAFRMLAARRQVREQKLEFLNMLWSFRKDVRAAFQEVVIAQETYDALALLADLSERLWHISERLYKAGSVAGLDVLKAELAAHQSTVDREMGAGRVALAKQQLNIIMGRHPDMTIEVARLPQFRVKAEKTGLMPNLNKPVPPLQDFIELAFSHRLELRILNAQIAVAEAQLKNAWISIVPDPILAMGYSANNNGPSGPKIKAFFDTMNFEVPLFNFSQGDIPRLKATIRQYHTQILAQRNQITADVSTAYNHLVYARKKIAVYQDHILAESDRVAHLARRSYEVGQADITSTLQAQQANVAVKQSYLDAVNLYQQAFTELEQSVGEPLI